MPPASTVFSADRRVIALRSPRAYHHYHIVRPTKYRYKVLRGDLRLHLRGIIR